MWDYYAEFVRYTKPNTSKNMTSFVFDSELDDETTHNKYLLVRTKEKDK